MKNYHYIAGIYGLIFLFMLSVVLFDELWTGDVLQFIFDLFKYIVGFVVLIAINMFFKKNMGDPLWEKIANPYKDDEEKK